MNLVYVEWIDACGPTSTGWLLPDQIDAFVGHEWLVKDIGFIYKESEDYICLVGGFTEEDDVYTATYHRIVSIPKSTIRKRIDLTKHIKKGK